MAMFGRVSMLISVYGIESLKYILQLRGVFRTIQTREKRNNAQSACGPIPLPRSRGFPVPRRLSKTSLKIRQKRLYLLTPSVYNSATSYDNGANGGSK